MPLALSKTKQVKSHIEKCPKQIWGKYQIGIMNIETCSGRLGFSSMERNDESMLFFDGSNSDPPAPLALLRAEIMLKSDP